MVAYTKKAAQKYADIKRELVELAVEETNQSFRNSGLGHVRVELAYTYETDYAEEGEHFDHLWRFADKGDGYMEEVHALREKRDADVAVLVVDDRKGSAWQAEYSPMSKTPSPSCITSARLRPIRWHTKSAT